MVSFSCEVCNDTVLKKRLQQHQGRCRGAYFTCIDCSKTFYGNEHQSHTSCISEAEKYEKSLYKGPKKNQEKAQPQQKKKETKPEPKPAEKESKKEPSLDLKKYISKEEPTSLYKVFKSLKKDNKKLSDKSEFLKALKLKQNADGSVNVSL